jgi:hypothetical protein
MQGISTVVWRVLDFNVARWQRQLPVPEGPYSNNEYQPRSVTLYGPTDAGSQRSVLMFESMFKFDE